MANPDIALASTAMPSGWPQACSEPGEGARLADPAALGIEGVDRLLHRIGGVEKTPIGAEGRPVGDDDAEWNWVSLPSQRQKAPDSVFSSSSMVPK